MRYAHTIKLTLFIKPEEDHDALKKSLISLMPFNLEEQKIPIIKTVAEGFENKIIIYEIDLSKESHTNAFIKNLVEKLGEEKNILLSQRWSRLDDELYFYIRLDKKRLLNNEYKVTDSGECFHIKISIAAFPKKKEVALKIIEKIFS